MLHFELGCQFTLPYFGMGTLGALMAIWIRPGCYTELPRVRKIAGVWRIEWGAVARLVTGGLFGCIADCNNVNALLAGFFAWHVAKWGENCGWDIVKTILETFVKRKGD